MAELLRTTTKSHLFIVNSTNFSLKLIQFSAAVMFEIFPHFTDIFVSWYYFIVRMMLMTTCAFCRIFLSWRENNVASWLIVNKIVYLVYFAV